MAEDTEVSIQDMMQCRDRRVEIQNTFIQKYKNPVISFCMNIPGPVKTNALIQKLFAEGKAAILDALTRTQSAIIETKEFHDTTGDELILCVQNTADFLKTEMLAIEEKHPLGRLFDIDIIDTDGKKRSRASFRTCLICGRQAQECARSRRHSVAEMQQKIKTMLSDYFKN